MKKSEFDAHSIWQILESLPKEIEQIDLGSVEQVDDLHGEVKKLKYLSWCLKKSDPDLLAASTLDSLNGKLQNVQSAVRTFTSVISQPAGAPRDKNLTNQLNSLKSNLENAVADFAYPRIQQIFSSEASSAIDDVLVASREAAARTKREHEKERSTLEKELTELKDLLVAEQTRLKKQEENVSALETREKAFSVKVANDADAKATVFDGLIEERREELSKWQKNIEKEGQNFLNKIERFYRLSGDTTLAGRFVEASRLEAYSYYFMTFLSLSFFVGAIWAFLFGSSAIERLVSVAVDGALTAWLARVSLAAIFLVPAGVFSQQAAKHRRASVWYRTLGVRVATLKPYLDEFENGDEGYQEELKEILKAFFVSELKVDTDKRDTTIQLGMLENLFARFGNKTS